MKTPIECYIKQRMGNCLWAQIQALDECIKEKKKRFSWLEEQIKQREKAFTQKSYDVLMQQNFTLYDGFNWETLEQQEQKQDKAVLCPYAQYGCKAIYQLKCHVLDYHQERLFRILAYYNELHHLVRAVGAFHRISGNHIGEMGLSLGKTPFCFIGYYPVGPFKVIGKTLFKVQLFYSENLAKIHRQDIELRYQLAEVVMKDTYLSFKENERFLLQINWNLNEAHEELIIAVARFIQSIIMGLNQLYARRYGQLIGSYVEIESICHQRQMQVIKLMTSLGYQCIGQMKEGMFKESQFLICK